MTTATNNSQPSSQPSSPAAPRPSIGKSFNRAYKNTRDRLNEAGENFLEDHDLDWLFWLAGALLVGLVLVFLNYFKLSVVPYAAMFGGTIGKPHLFPILGVVMDFFSILITAGTASLIWAFVNFFQVQYLIIAFDKKFQQRQRRRTAKLARVQKTEDADVSSRMVRQAKKRESNAFGFVNHWGFLLAVGATIADFVVNVSHRPIAGKWTQMIAAKVGGNASLAINWSNAKSVLGNMVSVEIIVFAILIVYRYMEEKYTNE